MDMDGKTDASNDKKGAGEDVDLDLEANTSAFEALERDFQEVLQELMGDQSLEKFRVEYEKLHRALKKSHEQEKRLVKKCRELNSEILNNQAKIKTALRLSQEDQKTIGHLQKEMEKTLKKVYETQERETRAKETIGQLKEEMVNLSKLVEKGAGLSMNQENMVKELKQTRDELQRQLDEAKGQMELLNTQLIEQHGLQEELREERNVAIEKAKETNERLTSKENELKREQKRRMKTSDELHLAKVKLDKWELFEQETRGVLDGKEAKIEEVQKQLLDAKSTMEKYLKDYDTLFTRTQRISDDLDAQITKNKTQTNQLNLVEKELKFKVMEASRLTTDKATLERRLEKEHKTQLSLKQQVDDAKIPLQLAQQEIEQLRKELLNAHRQEVQLEKTAEKIEREKNVQMKEAEKAQAQTKEVQGVVKEQERVVAGLGGEVESYKMELNRLRKAIFSLEKDRERLGNEVGEQRTYYQEALDDGKLKDVQITELEKRVSEWEVKMRQQQALYEQVRGDRNQFSKQLIDTQDEIAEMRKKFKILGHQVEQLQEELASKEQALVKEHFDFQRAEKMREYVQNELNRKNQLIKQNHELVHQQDNELKRLASTIRKMDDEALGQRKEYDQVINERDILGTQLIRRNDELALLYEKLRVQVAALKTGELGYQARIDDIRMLRLKVKDLTREVFVLKSKGGDNESMKRDLLLLQRELLQEKTKVTALSEELENPLNVHRWRKLEGSDPATFELIQKVQTLQKRLIAKTEEVVEKGLVIQEKDQMYVELQNILARQPGPEVAEQVTVYQSNLKTKTRQMKAMASELNMCQAQVNEYRYEMERLNRELQEVKRKYFVQKRKDAMLKEMADEGDPSSGKKSSTQERLLQQQQAAARASGKRFAGGGYAINQGGR